MTACLICGAKTLGRVGEEPMCLECYLYHDPTYSRLLRGTPVPHRHVRCTGWVRADGLPAGQSLRHCAHQDYMHEGACQ